MRDVTSVLRIAERNVGGVTILDLAGRLVMDQGDAAFRDRVVDLLARQQKQMIINLQEVTYIDSAGVGMLVAKMLSVRRAGGDMKLLHLTTRSNRVMTITRLLTVFEAFDDEEEAIRSFLEKGTVTFLRNRTVAQKGDCPLFWLHTCPECRCRSDSSSPCASLHRRLAPSLRT